MKNLTAIIVCLWVAYANAFAQVSFSGNSLPIINVQPERSTGLDMIYVLNTTEGVSVSYTSRLGVAGVKWLSFQESGGGYAQEVTDVIYDGSVSTLKNIVGNSGYIIEDGSERYYFWLVDYSDYRLHMEGISFPEEQDCGTATINLSADCKPIVYYTINGVPKRLSRDIKVEYTTMEWDATQQYYNTVETIETLESVGDRITLTAPLCNTVFTVSEDRFLSEWNDLQILISDTYITKSIDVQSTAIQAERDNGNEQKDDDTALGGSAPVDIEFTAYCTDAVVYKEWQFSRNQDFSDIFLRMNEESVSYSFRENGTFYVKFIGSNDDASCTVESEIYEVNVGESVLECPNIFSPNATEGINDEWKVSYKSLVSFRCWIFNRYGVLICSFDDPASGWDGKYKGKYVNPGVYYYVIEAMGADGKAYKLKGDINILKSSKK